MTLKGLKISKSKRVFNTSTKHVKVKTHLKAGGWEELKKWFIPWGQSDTEAGNK